jgi:hypothetical protein
VDRPLLCRFDEDAKLAVPAAQAQLRGDAQNVNPNVNAATCLAALALLADVVLFSFVFFKVVVTVPPPSWREN